MAEDDNTLTFPKGRIIKNIMIFAIFFSIMTDSSWMFGLGVLISGIIAITPMLMQDFENNSQLNENIFNQQDDEYETNIEQYETDVEEYDTDIEEYLQEANSMSNYISNNDSKIDLQAVKAQIEASFAQNNGDLAALSDSQLAIIAQQYGIPLGQSSRVQTLSVLQSDEAVSAWRLPFSKGEIAAGAVGAIATGGAIGLTSTMRSAADSRKDEMLERAANLAQEKETQAAKKAREAITNASSSLSAKVEQHSAVNPMAAMIRKNFGQSLVEAGYTVAELTQMIDTDADGIITQTEIMQLIIKMTGSPPPPWVVDTIIQILDADQNGIVTIEEWWQFLEEVGFENTLVTPTITQVETTDEEPTTQLESTVEEPTTQLESTVNTTNADSVAEEIDKVMNELESGIEATQPLANETIQTTQAQTESLENSSNSQLDEAVNTANEKMIEQLYSARLSSDERAIIANAVPSMCQIKVERIERTLMVTDHYRGGHSIVGLLDGGPYKVSIMLPESENEVVKSFNKEDLVIVEAKITSWSSGLRMAKMTGTNAKSA